MPKKLLFIFVFICMFSGCAGTTDTNVSTSDISAPNTSISDVSKHTTGFFAMDTYMDFSIYGDESLLEGAESIINHLEALVSTTEPDSEIYKINQNGRGQLSSETAELLKTALTMCDITDGILDISIFPIVKAWGFTTGDYKVPSEEEIAKLLTQVDYKKIDFDGQNVSLPAGMEIDLGSIAKGYAGRKAAEYLRENGVKSALLNLGGNVQTVGNKPDGSPWRVAIQDPASDTLAGVLDVVDKAAVTSGGYQRYFTDDDGTVYWHIMNPSTGSPAKNGLISVTIVASDGAYCDALSTSLFIMGTEKAIDFWRTRQDFETVLITEEGELMYTPGLTFTPDSSAPYTVSMIEKNS